MNEAVNHRDHIELVLLRFREGRVPLDEAIDEVVRTFQVRHIAICDWPHPWPSKPALYQYHYNQNHNGFDGCFTRCGRKVLVNELLFFERAAGLVSPKNAERAEKARTELIRSPKVGTFS